MADLWVALMSKNDKPDWWDDDKVSRAYYASGYTGWIIDNGDGTCYLANEPLIEGLHWGDLVELHPPARGETLGSIGEKIDAGSQQETGDSQAEGV